MLATPIRNLLAARLQGFTDAVVAAEEAEVEARRVAEADRRLRERDAREALYENAMERRRAERDARHTETARLRTARESTEETRPDDEGGATRDPGSPGSDESARGDRPWRAGAGSGHEGGRR